MLLKQCMRIALRELKNRKDSWNHWSFIVQKGSIVEYGINRTGEPSGYYMVGYKEARHCLHSELVALSKARGLMDMRKPWSLINIRLTKQGDPVLAAPCRVCSSFMRACGCHEFIYTNQGSFVKILSEDWNGLSD